MIIFLCIYIYIYLFIYLYCKNTSISKLKYYYIETSQYNTCIIKPFVLEVIYIWYQISNIKKQKKFKSCTRGMDNIEMKRLLATVTLFIIVVRVAMKANDLLSHSVPPLSPHNMAVASHFDMEKFTDKEECIKYCDESCADL